MSMDKEQILAAARKNKYRGQEYENRETDRSSTLTCFITLFVAVGLYMLEYFIKGSTNVGLIAVWLTLAGVDSLYEGIKLKQLHKTILGVLLTLGAVIAILFFVGQVMV